MLSAGSASVVLTVEQRPPVCVVEFSVEFPLLRVAACKILCVVAGGQGVLGRGDGMLAHKLHAPLI